MSDLKELAVSEGKHMFQFAPGTIIRHRHSADALIVTANYGRYAVAVRTSLVTHPKEWLIFSPPNAAEHTGGEQDE